MQLRNLLFIPLFIFSKVQAQTPEQLLEKVKTNFTPEKIYIHFDKQSYLAGDTIWFKAYFLDGIVPSRISTVLNIELLSDSVKLISRKVIPITASMAANAIEIPSNLKEGAYTISAYTSIMMNFGTASFYNKQINIYNPQNRKEVINETFKPDIKFLPESGSLVADLNNTVAFKCVDNNGHPLEIEGKIVNTTGEQITTFKSTHDGMGKFELKTEAGEKYFAECVINGLIKKSIALPELVVNSSLMKVSLYKNKYYLQLNNSNVSTDNKQPAYILGVIENLVAFKIPLNKEDNIFSKELPLKDLPTGILKITSFNKDDQPLNERLVFINTNDYYVKSNIVVNKFNNTARSKNEITISVEDTTSGSYSVAITNADTEVMSIDGTDNIISRFLLSDNLKGKIHNPAYYFEANDSKRAEDLDLVMLTNGWRRYNWLEIMTNKFPSMIYKDPNYITLKGSAFELFSKNPVSETSLSIIAKTKDTIPAIIRCTTDKYGNFEIPRMMFEDTASFFIQKSEGKERRLNLKQTSSSIYNTLNVTKNFITYHNYEKPTATQNNQIDILSKIKASNLKNIQLLSAVTLNSKMKTKAELYEKKYVTGVFSNGASKTYDFLTTPPPDGINILEYLKSRVPGVTITGGPLSYSINYRNTRSLLGGNIEMAIFLDGFQVQSDQVATMRAVDIALVKVYGNSQMVGAGGAIALYTNKEKTSKSLYSSFSEFMVEGFSVTKEFYSPNYDESKDIIGDDNRTTLYWNPYLVADNETKKINISFFNSDNAKKFKVIVEGFTRDGGLIHLEKIIE
jgi:hypothetical protein